MALLAAHSSMVQSSAVYVFGSLPEPKAAVTIPVIIIFAVLVLVGLMRKVMALAVIAAIICVGFLLYQSGALNHWVDKGKGVIQQK